MSADNTGECPSCKEWMLREWTGLGISFSKPHDCYMLLIEYRCKCKECEYEFAYKRAEHVPQPRKAKR